MLLIAEVTGFVLVRVKPRRAGEDVHPQGQEEDPRGQEEGEAGAGDLGHVVSQGLAPQL